MIIHASSVHPCTDNRIYNKYVCKLAERGFHVLYICRNTSKILNNGFDFIPLENNLKLSGRIKNSYHILKACWNRRGASFHFHDPELIIVAILLKLRGLNVIYDIHEDNFLSIKQKKHLNPIIRKPIAWIVRSIEYIVKHIFNTVIAEKSYRYRFPKAIEVLNYPLIEDVVRPKRIIAKREDIHLLYTGSITIDRGLINHLNILKTSNRLYITFVGSISDNLKQEVLNKLSDSERARVEFVTSEQGLPYSEIKKHYQDPKYHYGLAVFPATDHYLKKELTKFFEYAQFNLPVICSDFPVWSKLIEGNGIGICVNPEELDSVYRNIERDFDRYTQYANNCMAFSKQYSWDQELEKVIEIYG